MVKNKTGGKKSKGLARKVLNAEPFVRKLFLKEDAAKESEGMPGAYYYAKVTRAYGDCRFLVECDDGTNRVACCKHMHRSRRENNVELGSCLLVGVADYHTSNGTDKPPPCQTLVLYMPVEAVLIPFFQVRDSDEDGYFAEDDTTFNQNQNKTQKQGKEEKNTGTDENENENEDEGIDFSSI
jgi:translation initiation factor IF-1